MKDVVVMKDEELKSLKETTGRVVLLFIVVYESIIKRKLNKRLLDFYLIVSRILPISGWEGPPDFFRCD